MLRNVHLVHLGLPVLDAGRSRTFYERYFAFDPESTQRYDDGTVIIRNDDGFDLALHPGAQVGPMLEFLHLGFRFDEPAEVRDAGLRGPARPPITSAAAPPTTPSTTSSAGP